MPPVIENYQKYAREAIAIEFSPAKKIISPRGRYDDPNETYQHKNRGQIYSASRKTVWMPKVKVKWNY